jgi:hypothetical protein
VDAIAAGLTTCKAGLTPRIEHCHAGGMGFINDTSKEVCGARGVPIVDPTKAELSFRPELHVTTPRKITRWTPRAKAVDPVSADMSVSQPAPTGHRPLWVQASHSALGAEGLPPPWRRGPWRWPGARAPKPHESPMFGIGN